MTKALNLSKHFTLAEASVTSTKIYNDPPTGVLSAMIYTATQMEKVRTFLNDKAIRVSSWYRSYEVNKAVGGAATSQHLKGEAVDFTCPAFGSPKEIATLLATKKDALKFDQLIYEGTWVHISFCATKSRGDVLTRSNGKYLIGIL